MLAPIERVRFWHCVEAIYVGLFANEVVPLRAGEIIRCFLLSKSTDIPLSVTFASALIERIFDGIWLMACFFLSLHMQHHMPPVMKNGGYLLGGLIIFCAAIIGLAMYAKQTALDQFLGWSWPHWFNTLIQDLQLIGHSRYSVLFVPGKRGISAGANDSYLCHGASRSSPCAVGRLIHHDGAAAAG